MKNCFTRQKSRLFFVQDAYKLMGLVQLPEGGRSDGVVPVVQGHIFGVSGAESDGKHQVQQVFCGGKEGGDGQLVRLHLADGGGPRGVQKLVRHLSQCSLLPGGDDDRLGLVPAQQSGQLDQLEILAGVADKNGQMSLRRNQRVEHLDISLRIDSGNLPGMEKLTPGVACQMDVSVVGIKVDIRVIQQQPLDTQQLG